MHYQEFSKRIKEKYPQYNDIDDRELATRIVAKYPQYQVDFDDNRVAPQTVSTQQGSNNSSPNFPQVEQSPVNSQGTTFAEGMGRIGNAVSTGVGNFVDTVKANPMQFAKDSVNSFVVQPAKEFLGNVLNPDVKKSPWLALAGGIAKGAVELPQNIQNTVADIQDTYHGVEGMHNKWNYTDSIKDAVQSNPVTNLAYETVAEPMRNNEGLTTLAEFGGMGGAGLAPVKGISKLNNMAKVANQTARITAKLDDAQKLKYAKQIDKLAKKRVAEGAKTYINPALKEFNDNVLLGGALGGLEGETLEERASNAVGGLATGAIAHGAVKGAGKAYNKAKPVINEAIKNASESDLISKGIANIDSMLNTNISKNTNELTQKRKEYRDLISKDTTLAKNLTEEQIKALEKADELSTQEQLELFERNLQGDKKYSYAEKKAERKQKAIEQQKAREAKEQQETKEFFDNLLEEENVSTAPVSEVSNPVDINTPKLEGTAVKTNELPASVNPKKSRKEKIARQQEIIEKEGGVRASDPSKLNIDIKSQIEAKRRSKPRSFVVEKSGDNTYLHGKDGVSKVYGKNGKSAYVAEGARSLEKRTAGEENIYKNHEFYDNVVEDGVNKNYVKEGYHEVDASEPLYKYSQDTTPEFMKWYDEYSKADSKTKNKMLSEKLKSYKTQDEASKFYEKFSEQEMMGNQAKRAKKVGDETYDTADVSETKRLAEAIEKEDIQYEKAEPEVDVHSSGFRKLLEASWDKMPRGKAKNAKTYIKGKLMAWRESADFQKEYDKTVKQLSGKGFSPKIQEAMLSDINAIADSVIESKKEFGVTYKKTRNLTQNIYNQLVEANKTGQLAKGKQIIDSNNLKHKYVDENMKNALKEHYIDSVEKANAKLNAMGVEKNAQGEYVFNQEKAIEWAKNESKSKYKNNHRKLAKDLELLEKRPDVALERAKNAINKVISANKNIIANDTRFAFEAPQKQLKEISAKGDQQRWKVEETGDTWDRKSSDVDAGERLANKASTSLENIYNRDLGKEYVENRSKSMSKVIEDLDKMTTKEILDAWDKYGKDLDQHYMNNSGKDVVPNSELPSAKYFEAKKRVDTIKNFDESVKANGELKAGKISNKDYAEFGTDENLKQYAKDYPDSEIVIDKHSDTGLGAYFNNTTENIFVNTDYQGSFTKKFVLDHEFRHSQQWKDPANQRMFEELWEITANYTKSKLEATRASELVKEFYQEGKLKLRFKKDGSLHSLTVKKLNELLGEDMAQKYIDYCQNAVAYVNHILEKDANSFAQGVDNGSISKQLRTNNGVSSTKYNSSTLDSKGRRRGNNANGRIRGNSKGKMDEANTEVKSIQEEVTNGKQSGNNRRKNSGLLEEGRNKNTQSAGGRREGNDIRGIEGVDQSSENVRQYQTSDSKVVKFIEDEFNQPTDTYSKFESKSAEIRGVQHHFNELDKRSFNLFDKYGTYTPEQMRNRIRKQGGGDDAVYFKQAGQPQGKVTFGEQENTKVGFTGEKKYDGLKQKGSRSQSLALGFQKDIRLNHYDQCIEFLKRNFDNTPREGFVPVNTKLLFNTMFHGQSKAYYETLAKGESAIREVFTNKAQADNWVKLAERIKANEADLYIPKDLFEMSITGEKELPLDYLKTYGRKAGSVNQIKAMGKIAGAMLDYYNDRFKRKVLTSASFFTNNRFGNQIMLMTNASSPAEYFRSIKDAIKLKDSDIPTEILESTLAEAVWQETGGRVNNKINPLKGVKDNLDGKHSTKRYFSENRNNAFDNLVRVLDGVMINTEGLTGGKKLLAQGANIALAIPNAVFKEISNTMMGINAKAERFERKQAFAQSLNKMQKEKVTQTARKMATVKHLIEEIKSDSILRQTVIDKVADVLGDYNNFNKFEKNFMKRIIPFYAWNRTILRHSIALCKDNPTKLALIALKTLELHTQDDGLEDYQHGALKTGIYDKTSGKNLVINKTKMIPYATLFDMASGESIGSISPGIKKPIEAVQGEKWFKPSSEIQNKRYKRMSHKGQKGYLDTKTGEFKEGGLPAGARLAYVGKDALETVYPHIGSPLTKGVLSKDVIEHHNKTGEWRLPDKQYDASLGGFYDGDYIGSYNGKAKKRSAKIKMDLGHQVANRLTGLGLQPEQRKAQKEKWKKQSRKLRGY